ncbi:MAG: PASTA domain-containing protein [Clostridiales bacterium]|nr:PASTA domain-containing protein [Candidatus Scatonaster coprocaballi]
MGLFEEQYKVCPHCGYTIDTPAEEPIHLSPGSILQDRYIVGKVLGYGGFGVTYLAWDGKLEQKVAIREYLPGEFSTRIPGQLEVSVFNGVKNEQFHAGLQKFVDEAKRVGKFQSEPGIVKVFNTFEENATAYIVMEYLEGETLSSYIKREGKIPEEQAVNMLLPIIQSLIHVHEEGLLHRDIAPDNIFLTNKGETKLIDFGASRYATTSHSRSLTVIVKPGYSPEEQYRSRGDQGEYTDVYSLAATLYKMITGKTPPDAMERRAKFENKNKDILVAPHTIDKTITRGREVAILNAMSVRIEDRTPDVATFLSELNANPPAKRRYGKIKKIDVYAWPMWLKAAVPIVLVALLTFGVLLLTGVINFSRYSNKVHIPENLVRAPYVEGCNYEEARSKIESGGLHAVITGNIESDYIAPGKVMVQDPVAGAFKEKNSDVLLLISSGNGVVEPHDGIATIPFLIGDTRSVAIDKCKRAGLGVPQFEEVYDEIVYEGLVVSVSKQKNEEVPVSTSITIYVSKGPAPFMILNVVGMEATTAQSILEDQGLIVDVTYESNSQVPEGVVISQTTQANEYVRKGDRVTIVVSSGEKLVEVPNLVGRRKEEVQKLLELNDFVAYVVENYDDTIPAGLVISQTPAGGTFQKAQTTITVFVSLGANPNATSTPSPTQKLTSEPTPKPTSKPTPKPTPTSTPTPTKVPSPVSNTPKPTATPTPLPTPTKAPTPTTAPGTLRYVVGMKKADAVTALQAKGLKVEVVEVSDESVATGYVVQQNPSAGAEIKSGMSVTLKVSTGKKGILVHLDTTGADTSFDDITVYLKESYGNLPVPTKAYYHFDGWYTSATGGSRVTSDTIVSVSDTHTLYAQWTQNSVSDWVLASDVPSNAQIVETKYTYTLTEYTSNSASSLSGWGNPYDKQRTSWGATQGPVYSNPNDGSRNVWSEQYVTSYTHHYKYYHRYGYGYIQSKDTYGYTCGTDSSMKKGTRHEIDLTYSLTKWDSRPRYKTYTCPQCGNAYDWYYDGEYDDPQYGTRWYYQEPVYTYYFSRNVSKESSSDPTGQSNVSNVKKYVKYREK